MADTTAVVEALNEVRPNVDRPVAAWSGSRSDRYLAFVLGGDVYAVDILDVTEIMEFRTLTVVPMVPEFIRGVINLRGSVVPVVDLALRFGKQPTQVARRTSILIVETSGADGSAQHIGILVDAVNKVLNFGATEIEPPPAFGAGIRTDFISGMARHNGEFVIILDVDKVLSLSELHLVTQAMRTVTAAEATE
ncbi:MAG TPA: chemotaxis protein CheW [Kineosporiaceae bacterium]